MARALTVENLSEARYATAPEGEHPNYEARIHDGTAMLIAHRNDDQRPSSVDWYDHQWAREQTATWGDTTL